MDEALECMTDAIKPILTGCDNSDSRIDSTDNNIIQELKTKFEQTTDRIERYRILTTVSPKWSARKMRAEFGISADLAKRAKELYAVKGIMSAPLEKVHRPRFDQQTLKCVEDFYLDDENSRACPGKRDYVTVNSLGVKEKKQRRLLLLTINEAYAIFKEKHPHIRIGISKFAEMRPRECTLISDKKEAHATCICIYHQNVKLIFNALKAKNFFDADVLTYKNLLQKIVCENPTDNCFLQICDECPGTQQLEEALVTKLYDNFMDEVKIRQWTSNEGKITSLFVYKYKR